MNIMHRLPARAARSACSRFPLTRIKRFAYLFGLLGIAQAVGCGGGGGGGSAPATRYTASFQEFVVPVAANDPTDVYPGAWPDDIVGDNQGGLWFALHQGNEIGSMTFAGKYTGYPVPTPRSGMDGIAFDAVNHLIWATENDASNIVRLDMRTGKVTEIPTPTPNAEPGDIAGAPDGTFWITEGYEGGIGKGKLAHLNPANGAITEVALPSTQNTLDGIVVDSAGVVWFVELDANKIGRYANGQFKEYPTPHANSGPTNISIDTSGRIWITEQTTNAVARLDPATGLWQEYPIPTANGSPSGIYVDGANNVWFTEFLTNKIGVIPAGTSLVLDYTIPTTNSGPEDIRNGSNGKIYFTERYGDRIGQISVTGLPQ